MLAAIITVALALIIAVITLDTFPTSNLFTSSDVFLQKYVSAQPCGGLLQTGQGEVQFDQGGLEGGGSLQLSDWFRGEGWEEGPDRAMAIDMMIKGGLERRI